MTLLKEVNSLFKTLLTRFNGGISNTSTVKYNEIKSKIAAALDLQVEDVYATGAALRISNLDTRLAQGNQRNQHSPLAVVFIKVESAGRSRESVLDRARDSFLATTKKFVTGEERGTTFDGILGFVQVDDEDTVSPLCFLVIQQGCAYRDKMIAALPGISEFSYSRANLPGQPILTYGNSAKAQTGTTTLDDTLISACEADLSHGGLKLSKGLLARFVAGLLVKRFVILTGLSGSGKTKLALGFGRWLEEVDGQVEVVAVGADWTSTESVLGYRDALDPDKYRKPPSGALDIILRAIDDPGRPYFLILDEMNLSHVERYFSDFLSAMESGCPIVLHSSTEDVENVPPRISLPQNLFIIGTVNVDETTYMFSPKVLDRANVVEFRATLEEIKAFLLAPASVDLELIAGKGAEFQPMVVDASKSIGAPFESISPAIADGVTVRKDLAEYLSNLFEILAPIGAEFGFRTAMEISRFVCLHASLVGNGWSLTDALDAQLLQKLMPKLHGSDRRLRPILQGLGEYCENNELVLSKEKVIRMQDRLRDGFASFID